MKTYKVNVTRVGEWWALDAPEVRFGTSQCKRLDQAEAHIREAIAIALDVDEDSFKVELDIEPPARVQEALRALEDAERRLAESRIAYFTGVVTLVDDLGLSYRDAGTMLGLSHQRIGQIVKEERALREGGDLVDA